MINCRKYEDPKACVEINANRLLSNLEIQTHRHRKMIEGGFPAQDVVWVKEMIWTFPPRAFVAY
jgi:hypothetical protein